jgi:CubicO group peptidase (beta-lactamase class C family)
VNRFDPLGRLPILGYVALLCGLSCASTATENTTPTSATKSARFEAIDRYVEGAMRDLQIPGVALAIVEGDRISHLPSFGVADQAGRRITAQTPFQIGSITKSFTALAILQLVEAGKVELDAPVQRYLPWFRVADPAASARITVRHLLNQTTGLSTLAGNAYWASRESLETTVRSLQSVTLDAPVGTRFQYSNVNYSIAGLIIEVVSGQSYADYLAQHVFAPLAMRNAHANLTSTQSDSAAIGHLYSFGRMIPYAGTASLAYLPAGFISASAQDMAHYAIAMLNAGRFGARSVLSAHGIEQLTQAAIPITAMLGAAAQSHYAMGWVTTAINDTPTIWHDGDTGRFHAIVLLVPSTRQGIVLLANASGLEHMVAIDEVARGVSNLLSGAPDAAPSSARRVNRIIYWVVLLTPLGLLIGVLRGWQRIRRGRITTRAECIKRILWMVVPNLGIALFFVFGLPQASTMPHSSFQVFYPDLSGAVLASIVIGFAWSIVYPSFILRHALD